MVQLLPLLPEHYLSRLPEARQQFRHRELSARADPVFFEYGEKYQFLNIPIPKIYLYHDLPIIHHHVTIKDKRLPPLTISPS